ncbi:MAG: NAD(P)H-hydrate epimerase, partial [Salibacteraceae bacterium]
MKIFSAQQTQKADVYTIANEPIESIDLMERASKKVFKWLRKTFKKQTHFDVFCGPGNNGGDGLAVARMLHESGFSVKVWILEFGTPSVDNLKNREGLNELAIEIQIVNEENNVPKITQGVIVDAIFGSGLTRSVTGWIGELIDELNQKTAPKVSIDIASGLFAENNDENKGEIFQPVHTLTFEMEKLAFQFPENQPYVGQLKVLPIGLHPNFISKEISDHFITSKFTAKLLHKRGHSFAYKNNFGHALIVAGSTGKMGAAVLCAKACLKSGAGLVTANIPAIGNDILQISAPEVMTIPYSREGH